jgi:ABC-type transport system substrate-binding protein
MKRTLSFVLFAAFLISLAACATAPATPSVTGTITAMTDNSITVTPAAGSATTVTTPWGTQVWWRSGLEAQRSQLTTGQRVSVFADNGKASKIIIEY